ncbi:hypothetical protein D3C76_1038630 [compost metagenome]
MLRQLVHAADTRAGVAAAAFQVGAGAEGAARAGDDQCAGVVGGDTFEVRFQFVQQVIADRIQGLGAVQRQHRADVLPVVGDAGHGSLLGDGQYCLADAVAVG